MNYSTNQIDHFNLCSSFHVHAQSCHKKNSTSHQGLELIVHSSGDFQECFREQMLKPTKKNVLIYNALEEHTEIYSGNSQVLAIVIESEFIDSLFNEFGVETKECVFDKPIIELPNDLFNAANEILGFRHIPGVSKFSFECALAELCIAIFSDEKSSISSKLSVSRKKFLYPTASRTAARLIYSHRFDPSFSLDELAERSGFSKFHLIRTFKQNYSVSPHKFLNLLRLDSARMKLATTRDSITSIAFEIGYEDISTFNKQFKSSSGMAPNAFRQQEQQFFPSGCLMMRVLERRSGNE